MAKGNLFLGTARGSVGDVTMYQNRGQQAARVRKRVIANPKSDPQLVTRAILASVAKAYSAGRAIFDHSFEGRRKGQENQDRFYKLNIAALRAAFNDDMQTAGVSDFTAKGRFVQRDAMGPVPFSFIVSEGSLTQNFMTFGNASSTTWLPFVVLPTPNADQNPETVGEYLSRNGVQVGDIFTIVGFGYEDMGNYSIFNSFPARFQFVRLVCIAEDSTLVKNVTEAYWDEVFDIDYSVPNPIDMGSAYYGLMSASEQFDMASLGLDIIGAFGVIRSRDDRDLRSTCKLTCTFDMGNSTAAQGEDYQWGLSSLKLTNGWRSQSPEAEDSPLILEGGNVAAALDEIGKE